MKRGISKIVGQPRASLARLTGQLEEQSSEIMVA